MRKGNLADIEVVMDAAGMELTTRGTNAAVADAVMVMKAAAENMVCAGRFWSVWRSKTS